MVARHHTDDIALFEVGAGGRNTGEEMFTERPGEYGPEHDEEDQRQNIKRFSVHGPIRVRYKRPPSTPACVPMSLLYLTLKFRSDDAGASGSGMQAVCKEPLILHGAININIVHTLFLRNATQ